MIRRSLATATRWINHHLHRRQERRGVIIAILALAAVVGLWIFLVSSPSVRTFLSSPDALREWVRGYGRAAPLLLIILHIGQVILAPIPGQAIDISNGYLFGSLAGSLYSMIGISIGTAIAIFLADRFGRRLVRKLAGQKRLERFDQKFGRKSMGLFLVLFLLPGTPDDFLCFAIGLTHFPFWKKLLISFARTPTVIGWVLLGASGQQMTPWEFAIIAALVSVALLLVLRAIAVRKNISF